MPWSEYEYLNLTEGGFFKAFQYANTITYDVFGLGILFGFFLTLFISFRGYGTNKAFAAASFMTTLLAIIMRAGELVGDSVTMIFIIMSFISVLVMGRE